MGNYGLDDSITLQNEVWHHSDQNHVNTSLLSNIINSQ